jgi:hypothetical protein
LIHEKTPVPISPVNNRPERANKMNLRDNIIHQILSVTHSNFNALALEIFEYQYNNNKLYHQYCQLIRRTPEDVHQACSIPHLPIALFKHNLIKTNEFQPEIVFESSKTTGQIPSQHAIRSLELYRAVAERGFEHAFGKKVSSIRWLGLLPSYLERPKASLVYMVGNFIALGGGGFFISDYGQLRDEIAKYEADGVSTVLIGVSFALMEYASYSSAPLNTTVVIETGGMKGRMRELTRMQLHDELKSALGVEKIYSEYGMTELLSQAWSDGTEKFFPSTTMRVQIREITDPMTEAPSGTRGALNVTDLANIDSCSFIATDDAGIRYADGSFEVLGRLDGSEQRGCNLMHNSFA